MTELIHKIDVDCVTDCTSTTYCGITVHMFDESLKSCNENFNCPDCIRQINKYKRQKEELTIFRLKQTRDKDSYDRAIEGFRLMLRERTEWFESRKRVSMVEMVQQEQFTKACEWSIKHLEIMIERVG
ncbi:MAG: hypothetical protein KAS32_26825 [Candidatus Peribacteraceae bacterium]|nr:hypothetical protein [Candidatus Peribacteraceae bacterium]